jgi:hypothetical protein
MKNDTQYLNKEVKVWVKRKSGPDEIMKVIPELSSGEAVARIYWLYSAFDENPDKLGRILFDPQGYWIYDGDILTIAEQEQVAKFIINYVETL